MVPRAVCAECLRAARVCCCHLVPTLTTDVALVVVQHPREARVPIGTAAMAARAIVGSHLFVGADVDDHAELRRLVSDPARPAVLLWPGEGARDLETDPPALPLTLVVVDGTWSTARKLLQRNVVLRDLPRVRLTPDRGSAYRIRREPRAECLSTIEAVSRALGCLERDERKFHSMLGPFERMVAIQLEHQARAGGPRAKRRRGPKPPSPWPVGLGDPECWACLFAEGNAFPYATPGRPPEEILHVVAERFGTGERIELFARPSGALAPSALTHADLRAELFADAVPRDELRRRLGAFLAGSDRVAGWGTHSLSLLDGAGVDTPPFVDLRPLAARLSPGPLGSLEVAAARSRAERAPTCAGRAGRRLALALGLIDEIRRHHARRMAAPRHGETPPPVAPLTPT